ncbi:hypothetical protein MMC28_011129 [Mycoblastus sanguinarius]|nr:hypothetical protein [Mycoblastus sanguinarius]
MLLAGSSILRLRALSSDSDVPPPSSFRGALQQYMSEERMTASPVRRTTRATSSAQSLSPSHTPSLKRKAASVPNLSPSPVKNERPSPSGSPSKKKKRPSSGYAPPSKYAHLPNHLTDSLAPNLLVLFVGLNPGLRTGATGHAYAHPSNLFWKLAYSSGCTPRLCKPEEDHDLPHLYCLGHTNLVSRATRDGAELSRAEMDEGVEVLEEKVRKWRPEVVAVVGKGIWESIWRARHGHNITKDKFKYGWQDEAERMGAVKVKEEEEEWKGARVFVATTTSGLAAGMRPHEKEEVWRGLGEWVEKRRRETGIPDQGGVNVEEEVILEGVREVAEDS